MGGQPDNLNEEDCGELVGYENGQWNDEDCDSTRKFICKHINGESVPVSVSVCQCWRVTSYM